METRNGVRAAVLVAALAGGAVLASHRPASALTAEMGRRDGVAEPSQLVPPAIAVVAVEATGHLYRAGRAWVLRKVFNPGGDPEPLPPGGESVLD